MAKRKNNANQLFVDYFDNWVEVYKRGAIKPITLQKYEINGRHLRELCPDLKIKDFTRHEYQNILNGYAETHEKQTTMDFHHQVKSCIKEMFYDGLLEKDPTFKAVIKGKEPRKKKTKFLQKDELAKLVNSFDLSQINRDWFLLIIAKTGMRFAEALAITPADFNLKNNTLNINKTWDYKEKNGGFDTTKNISSVRTIAVDWQIIGQFVPMLADLPPDEPIFIKKNRYGKYIRVFNSTYNDYLTEKCKKLGITVISLHGLRHTHASVLLSAGVSIHSISKRLGHSNVTTTQEVYTHIIDELKKEDDQKMLGALMALGTGA